MLKEPMDLRYNSRFIAILIMSIYPHISVFGKYTRMMPFIIVYICDQATVLLEGIQFSWRNTTLDKNPTNLTSLIFKCF